MMSTYKLALLALAVLLFAPEVRAEKKHIELDAVVEREIEVVGENGEKTIERRKADKVVPGETVIYTITARNVGDDPATNVVITDPIPQHMDFTGWIKGEGTQITYSADGGETWGAANVLTVPDGEGERPATPEDYTHIRWKFNDAIEPGSSRSVEFRARLQ